LFSDDPKPMEKSVADFGERREPERIRTDSSETEHWIVGLVTQVDLEEIPSGYLT
jgi:hypothetical protein